MEQTIELMRTLSEADGVPGHEETIREIMLERLAGKGEVTRDRMGGFVCDIAGSAPSPRVLLDAHMDEVGFMVQHITKDGFLKFVSLGGWSKLVLSGMLVRVRSRSGESIPGMVASTPPHLASKADADKAPDESKLTIDIGAADREQAESWGVYTGAPVAPATPFSVQPGGSVVMGKAFDDRVGCAVALEVAAALDGSHPNTVAIAASTQEELGCRGVRTTCHLARPDVAIVLEGPPADDTAGMPRDEAQGRLGGGVQVRRRDVTSLLNPRLCDFAIDVAEECGIPYQVTVRRGGGTDAKEIHLFEAGVPTIVLGVPARYIHAPAGFVHLDDLKACRDLTLALLARLDEAKVAEL